MDLNDLRKQSLARILSTAALGRRSEIDAVLYNHLAGAVHEGPFQGLRLSVNACWGNGDFSPKLLGCYEAELHDTLRDFAKKGHPIVVNVGCAEGYYSVGLARLMPHTRVFAFDSSSAAQEICRQTAQLNGVADRIQVGGLCDVATLQRVLSSVANAFLLLDCEGAEKQLLLPEALPELSRCDFIVECHDCLDRSITPTLQARFEKTHLLEVIREGARDPNRYPFMQSVGSLDRWLAVCEFRPEPMHWLIGRRRC